MTLPIADMRGVRFNPETNVYSRRTGDLCERCGQYDQCEKSSKVLGEGVFVKSECDTFLPIVMFVNPSGTDDEFTTIRLGKAWPKRVIPGTTVALFSKKNGRYGVAKVTFCAVGDKHDMISDSLATNHLMLGLKESESELVTRLTKIVRNSYGNLIYKNNEYATIIGLRRTD